MFPTKTAIPKKVKRVVKLHSKIYLLYKSIASNSDKQISSMVMAIKMPISITKVVSDSQYVRNTILGPDHVQLTKVNWRLKVSWKSF